MRLLALPGPSGCMHSDSEGGGQAPSEAPEASAAAPTAICCITGGEDATVRQLLLPLPQGQSAGGNKGETSAGDSSTSSTSNGSTGLFSSASLLAEQARGTAVKSLALLPLLSTDPQPQRQWLLLSAGARQTLLLSRLRQQEGLGTGGGPLPLLCDELAVKDPVASDKRTPRSEVRSNAHYIPFGGTKAAACGCRVWRCCCSTRWLPCCVTRNRSVPLFVVPLPPAEPEAVERLAVPCSQRIPDATAAGRPAVCSQWRVSWRGRWLSSCRNSRGSGAAHAWAAAAAVHCGGRVGCQLGTAVC